MIKYYCDACQCDHTHEELCPKVKIAVDGMVKRDRELSIDAELRDRLRQMKQEPRSF